MGVVYTLSGVSSAEAAVLYSAGESSRLLLSRVCDAVQVSTRMPNDPCHLN
jgi:hypothetical protein